MELVTLVIFYISFVVLVGIMANKRKRSTAGWVILSLVVSPLITILFLLALGEKEEGDTPKVVEEKQNSELTLGEKEKENTPKVIEEKQESKAHEVNTHETPNHKMKAWEYLANIEDTGERKEASMKVFQNMKRQMIDKSDAEVTRAWQTIVSKANQIRKELKQQQAKVKEETEIKETPTCNGAITPKIAAITVVSILFVGMIGTTVYAVGKMQKMKHSAKLAAVQVVEVEKEAPVQIVEVEKECSVADDSLKQEYIRILDASSEVFSRSANTMLNLAKALDGTAEDYLSRGKYADANAISGASLALVELAKKQRESSILQSARVSQLRGY